MLPKPFKLTRINTNKTVSLITSVCIDLIFPFRSYLASSILSFWDKTHSHMCVRLQWYSKFFSYYSSELAMLRSLIQCMADWVRREMGSGSVSWARLTDAHMPPRFVLCVRLCSGGKIMRGYSQSKMIADILYPMTYNQGVSEVVFPPLCIQHFTTCCFACRCDYDFDCVFLQTLLIFYCKLVREKANRKAFQNQIL